MTAGEEPQVVRVAASGTTRIHSAFRTQRRSRRAQPPAALRRPAPITQIARAAAWDWAGIGVLWIALATLPRLWPLWVVLLAGRIHALGVLLHELCHRSLSGRTLPVRLLEAAVGYPVASTLRAMRYHHLRHHRDSGLPTDPYFKPGASERPLRFLALWLRSLLLLPFWSIRPFVGLVAWRWPAWRTPYARIWLQDRSGRDLQADGEVLACARAELGQAVVLVVLGVLTWQFPREIGLFYLLPAELAGLLAGWRLLFEHTYQPAADRAPSTTLALTCDHHLGGLGAWMLAPHGVGHHVVHHLHPTASYRSLPDLRRWYLAHHPQGYPPPRRALLPLRRPTSPKKLL